MGKDQVISGNDKEFIVEALRSEKRIDGRGFYDNRAVYMSFGEKLGQVEVQWGETKVLAVVTSSVVPPRPERPTEGFFKFQTEFSPMACMAFDDDRRSSEQIELGRVVERGLRESRAIDTEALCIVAGEKVWSIKCFIHILDHGGNLIDCSSLAMITALLHFRRPDVSVVGEEVTIHSPEDRLPVPLSVHHIPIAVSFAIYDDGEIVICDPSYNEELTMESRMTITLNAQEEICAIQKAGGTPLDPSKIIQCTRAAVVKVQELDELIKANLERDVQRRKGNLSNEAIHQGETSKKAKWEEIYKKDQEAKVKQEEKIVTKEKSNEEPKKKEPKKKEPKISPKKKDILFSGGVSSWEEDDTEVKSSTKGESNQEPMEIESDSEEEETIVLNGN